MGRREEGEGEGEEKGLKLSREWPYLLTVLSLRSKKKKNPDFLGNRGREERGEKSVSSGA